MYNLEGDFVFRILLTNWLKLVVGVYSRVPALPKPQLHLPSRGRNFRLSANEAALATFKSNLRAQGVETNQIRL